MIKNRVHEKNVIQMIKHLKSRTICVELMKSLTLLLIKNLIRTHANLTCFLGVSCVFAAQKIVTKNKNNCKSIFIVSPQNKATTDGSHLVKLPGFSLFFY